MGARALVCVAALGLGSSPAAADEVSHVLLADELPFFPSGGYETPARAEAAGKHHHGRGNRPYHPAPGIVVDVVDDHGSVLAPLQRAARNVGYWPFRHCYEEGLRRDQGLTGTVSLDLLVLPEGAPQRAELTATTLKDQVVAACVAREALHLDLVPIESPTVAKVRVLLATGDEPVPRPWAVPRAGELRAALRDSWSRLEQCYEATLTRHPDLGGRMELRFEVGGDGTLANVVEAGTRFSDPETTQCVVGVYRGATLASLPQELRGKGFIYPVHFEPRSGVLPVRL